MQAIDAGRQQYAELLADLGFIPASYAAHASAAGGRGRRGGGYSSAVSNPYGEGECSIRSIFSVLIELGISVSNSSAVSNPYGEGE